MKSIFDNYNKHAVHIVYNTINFPWYFLMVLLLQKFHMPHDMGFQCDFPSCVLKVTFNFLCFYIHTYTDLAFNESANSLYERHWTDEFSYVYSIKCFSFFSTHCQSRNICKPWRKIDFSYEFQWLKWMWIVWALLCQVLTKKA